MKKRKLTDFMPLYSNSKTGSIVIDEPARDEKQDLTTAEQLKNIMFPNCASKCLAVEMLGVGECESVCQHKFDKNGNPKKPPQWVAYDLSTAEMDKLVGDERPVTVLPELHGGELLLNPRSGKTYRVHVVRKPKRDTGFIEKLYRLENVVIGNQEWTGEELSAAGMKLEGNGESEK